MRPFLSSIMDRPLGRTYFLCVDVSVSGEEKNPASAADRVSQSGRSHDFCRGHDPQQWMWLVVPGGVLLCSVKTFSPALPASCLRVGLGKQGYDTRAM